MRTSPGIGHEPSLQRLVIASLILHFVFIIFLFLPSKTDKEVKTYYVSLAEPAKARGGGQTAVRKAEEKPVLKKETPVKEKKVYDKKADAKKKDLEQKMSLKEEELRKAADKTVADKIKRINDKKAAIDKLKEQKDREQTQVTKVEKNETSAKGAGAGKGGQRDLDSKCPYCDDIIERIWREWNYKSNNTGLEVEITIKIDLTGKVVDLKIDEPSGNKVFDDSARRAILKASPLPPPLEEMEIGLRFNDKEN